MNFRAWLKTWNRARLQELRRNNRIMRKIDSTEETNTFWPIAFTIVLVASLSFSFRLVENSFFTPSATASKWSGIPIAEAKTVTPVAKKPVVVEINGASLQTSLGPIKLKPGAGYSKELQFKNTGNTTWTPKTVFIKTLTTGFKYKHALWEDLYVPARLVEASVKPGEIGTFKLALQAPAKFDDYNGDFALLKDNVMIPGGEFAINVKVVEDPNKKEEPLIITLPTDSTSSLATNGHPTSPLVQKSVCTLKLNTSFEIAADELTPEQVEKLNVDNETCIGRFNLPSNGPNVSVGIYYNNVADGKTFAIRNTAAWQIYDTNDTLLASVPADQLVEIFFSKTKKQFSFDFIDRTVRSKTDLKLVNFGQGIYTITNYKDIPTWNKNINYNLFAGDLALKYNSTKERVWAVETLPIEEYLKGVKETSNADPAEYLKTMMIAARTYALYHVNKFYPEGNGFFDLYSDENDQVYKGYANAKNMPNLVAAVEATHGVVGTYDNNLILAYYSAISGGQTISSKTIPYLQSVETPYTDGKTMWGHGLGIDAWDARARAEKDGWNYYQLVKYYYTGIDLERIY